MTNDQCYLCGEELPLTTALYPSPPRCTECDEDVEAERELYLNL